MASMFGVWWKKIQQQRVAITIVTIVLVVVVALVIIGYSLNWTGFNGYNKVSITHTFSGTSPSAITRIEEYQPGRTLWDWLQLLIVPIVLTIGGFWLNQIQKNREERNTQQQSELLLKS